MGLDKKTADELAAALSAEFSQISIRVVTAINTDYRVQVDHEGKVEDLLNDIAKRANQLAGRELKRSELEFKRGHIYF